MEKKQFYTEKEYFEIENEGVRIFEEVILEYGV